MPLQNRVHKKYAIDLQSKSQCGPEIELVQLQSACIYKVIDGRTLIPVPDKQDNTRFVPLRAWQFPNVIDIVTMHFGMGNVDTIAGFDYPTLHFRVLVGMGGNTDRVLEGEYTPPNKTNSSEDNDRGLLFQYAGRMFDTLELHVWIEDPAAQPGDQPPPLTEPRKFPFVVAMYGAFESNSVSNVQCGLNSQITYVATTYTDIKDLVP